jgi:mRNA-degrading endonuclease YafQ of YafQ-DinJ toxin-antitoxin module
VQVGLLVKHMLNYPTQVVKQMRLSRELKYAGAGEWSDHRHCHVRLHLVLIYRKPDPETPELVRLSSHSEPGW